VIAGLQAEEVEAGAQESIIRDTARLFLRNLPFTASDADLAAAFAEHGELSEVHVVTDK
jgi:multiple RNA-binding domain-containing protein 1